jgi:hypothetical protein
MVNAIGMMTQFAETYGDYKSRMLNGQFGIVP